MEAVIQTEGLTKVYRPFLGGKGIRALNELTFSVAKGETFGLIGPNGSGKTTTLKLLLGLIYPTKGKATLFGKNLFDAAVKREIGYLPEEPYFYEYLSGEELLHFYAGLHGLTGRTRKQRVEEMLQLVGMTGSRQLPVRVYSKGMRQRIGLAQALINDPQLLILDEPTLGLDPIGIYQLRQFVRDLKARGKTVLLCSHQLTEVEALCDRIGILYKGKLIREGRMEELLPAPSEPRFVVSGMDGAGRADLEKLVQQHGGRIEPAAPGAGLEELFVEVIGKEGLS